MLKLLKLGKAAGVIIHKIDRSARNLRDWADLGELIDQGIQVHFANESLDLSETPSASTKEERSEADWHEAASAEAWAFKDSKGRGRRWHYPPGPRGR